MPPDHPTPDPTCGAGPSQVTCGAGPSQVGAAAGASVLVVARLVLLLVLLVAAGVVVLAVGADGIRDVLDDVGRSRWGLVAFVVVYALGVVLLVPGTLGTVAAGAVFGFPLGAGAALAGATLGATGSFFIARALGRDGAQQVLGRRFHSVDDWIGRNDFASMLVLRLMPIVPFNALNYAAGVTRVRPRNYVVASVIGMAPGTLLTTGLTDQAGDPTGTPFLVLTGLFVLALAGSIIVARRLRTGESA